MARGLRFSSDAGAAGNDSPRALDEDARRPLPGAMGPILERLALAAKDGLYPYLAFDQQYYLADDILVKVDRASMLSSLEVRAPFLDRRIIEFAFTRVPDRLRATQAGRKLLLRKLGQRILPEKLDLSRKQGFSIPLDQWMTGAFGSFMKDVLSDVDGRLFNASAIRELFDEQARGRSNANRLFALTLFELWRREYGISI